MSTKTMGKSAQTSKSEGKIEGKKETKKAKDASTKESLAANTPSKRSASPKLSEEENEETMATTAVDPDELEEQEEEAEASAAASGGSSNAAALAAASGPSEMSASFKNFRHHPDMENFYRFIYENDLRHEALAIIDEMMAEKQQRKLVKGAKTQAH